MKLQYVSLTGADDAVDVTDLLALSHRYPFAEWAILLLPDHMGKPRFPTIDWIKNFVRQSRDTNTALHLCGKAFLGFLNNDPEITDVMEGFDRIQLNLNFGNVEGRYDTATLVRRVKESQDWTFILQYDVDKRDLLPHLKAIDNHALLFDESAGQGLSPERWPAPVPGHVCGYAGGISPDNINETLKAIESVAPDYTTWIDMETGVRTDDRFDLAKAESVLQAAARYAAC